jgi:hypothetical protein
MQATAKAVINDPSIVLLMQCMLHLASRPALHISNLHEALQLSASGRGGRMPAVEAVTIRSYATVERERSAQIILTSKPLIL